MYARARAREKKWACVKVCVRVCERNNVCVCERVCVCEGERERERVTKRGGGGGYLDCRFPLWGRRFCGLEFVPLWGGYD